MPFESPSASGPRPPTAWSFAPPEPAQGRRARLLAATIAGAATVLLHAVIAGLTPAARFLKYSAAARAWVDGSMARERLADFSPLFFELAIALERLALPTHAVIAGAHFALAGISAALLFDLIARRAGPRFAAAGVAAFALSPHVLVYERMVKPDFLLLTLVLATLGLAETARSAAGTVAAGGAAALALTTRPSVLPFVAVAALLVASRDAVPRARLRRGALFLAPTLVAIALLALRSGATIGEPFAPRMSPGTVFFEGNRPGSRGLSAEVPPIVAAFALEDEREPDPGHVGFRRAARFDLRDGALSISEVNGLWFGRARSFLLDQPADAVRRFGRKLGYAFHGRGWHDVPSGYALERRLARWPLVPWALLAAAGLIGAKLRGNRFREDALLYALLALQASVLVAFLVSARQQLLLLPPLLVFAIATVRYLLDRDRPVRPRLAMAALLATLTWLLSLSDAAMRLDTASRAAQARSATHHAAAMAARSAGDVARFREERELALAHGARWLDQLWPADGMVAPAATVSAESIAARAAGRLAAALDDPAAPGGEERDALVLDLARLALEAGRPERALALLDGVTSAALRGSARRALLAARAESFSARGAGARDALREGLARNPGDATLLAELVVIGEPEAAAGARAELERYFGESSARLVVGGALFAHGQSRAAVTELEPLVTAFPELRDARLRLAIARAESGDLDGGVSELERELARGADPLVAPGRAALAIAAWRAAHAGDAEIDQRAAALIRLLGVAPEPPRTVR